MAEEIKYTYLDQGGLETLVGEIKKLDNAQTEAIGDLNETLSAEIAKAVTGASYNGDSKKLVFAVGSGDPIEVDATPFIKDGMVDGVSVDDGKLVITFNTESGKEDIELDIKDIFDSSKYYTKDEVDSASGDLDTKIEGVKSDLSDLSNTVEGNTSKISTVSGTVEDETSARTAADTALSGAVEDVKSSVETLQTTVDNLDETYVQHTQMETISDETIESLFTPPPPSSHS